MSLAGITNDLDLLESNGGKPNVDCISATPSDDCSGRVPSFSPLSDPWALLEVDVPQLFIYITNVDATY